MKPKFKLDDKLLLALLLKQNRMSHRQWAQRVKQNYNLSAAQEVSTIQVIGRKNLPGTDLPVFTDYNIWDTGKHLVKATKYGRIIDIEQKARSVIQPVVTVKKKRTISK